MEYFSCHSPKVYHAFGQFPLNVLRHVERIAFTGSRYCTIGAGVAGRLAQHLTTWRKPFSISVGDANGVDRAVVEALGDHDYQLFTVQGHERKHFAKRSTRCLLSALPFQGALVLAFPDSPCPAKVDMKPRFAGRGSGTWGTVGLALGHHVRVIMYVPPEQKPEVWAGPLRGRMKILVHSIKDPENTASDCGSWIQFTNPIRPVQASLF